MGTARAKEIALAGSVVDAEEALRIGMVNRVSGHEEVSGEVMGLGRRQKLEGSGRER